MKPELQPPSRVVVGEIAPIKASKLRLQTVEVPVEIPGAHYPTFVSQEPLVLSEATLEHAKKCAERLIERMGNLPHTPEAGDLLSMAYAVLHYTRGK